MFINTYYRTDVRDIAMLVKDPLGPVLDKFEGRRDWRNWCKYLVLVAGEVNNGTR